MHRVMEHNQLFYCTNNEIVVGDMPKTDMDPIHAEVCTYTKSASFLRLFFLLGWDQVCTLTSERYCMFQEKD